MSDWTPLSEDEMDDIRDTMWTDQSVIDNLVATIDELRSSTAQALREREVLEGALREIRTVVDEQAEDEGLWGVPIDGLQPITEAYLQQELRNLHRVIESSTASLPSPEPTQPASDHYPTQAETLEFVRQRWPNRVEPIWRAAKCAEEAGECLGALNKPWLTVDDLEHETAQLAICVMALAESAGFDLRQAVIDEWERASKRTWPATDSEGER